MATAYNYSQTMLPGETKAQFAKRMLIRVIKESVKETEVSAALIAERKTKSDSVDNDIQLT